MLRKNVQNKLSIVLLFVAIMLSGCAFYYNGTLRTQAQGKSVRTPWGKVDNSIIEYRSHKVIRLGAQITNQEMRGNYGR